MQPAISAAEFDQLRRLLQTHAGIALSDAKKHLVVGRLAPRLRHYGYASHTPYLRQIIAGDETEFQIMVDLLTTNETSFFREPKHFDLLRRIAAESSHRDGSFRVWSAACSSGEEPYTIAMVLMDTLGDGQPWDITATDISTRILDRARSAHYALERARTIPRDILRKYCLKGVRSQEGTFLIAPELRQRVTFRHLNLFQPLPDNLGQFDVIFLRNVMIYFDMDTKRKVVANLIPRLRREGYFLVGHSETLGGITDQLASEKPSIYRKP